MNKPAPYFVRVVDHRGQFLEVADCDSLETAKEFAAHSVTGPGVYRGAVIYEQIAVVWSPAPKAEIRETRPALTSPEKSSDAT